ncbi:MAG TPA: AbrB family transcriptional regulator [Beijerinckiaceae bacterium]|nr:AbrB family transcriptional regulator [Beijerinckiaceae bacterium]
MRPLLPSRDVVVRTAETLAVGAVGGVAFETAGFPAGLVAGAIIATAAAGLMRRPLMVPNGLTRVLLVTVGIALGSVVSPATLGGFAVYPLSIAVLSLAILCMTAATFTYLRFVHGWNPLSALLGGSPGALAQIMAIAAESGADVRGVVIVQTLRVILLAVGIPAGLALAGLSPPAPAEGPATAATSLHLADLADLAVLVAVSLACAFAFYRIGFSGGWLFGAMIGAAALNGSGLTDAHLPWWLADSSMVALGAVTGSRFAKIDLRLLFGYLLAALGSFTVAVTTAALFALIAASLVTVAPGDLVVAFSPGAQDTMMLLALALQLDPVFVGAHHLARYVLVSLGVSFVADAIIRRQARSAAPPPQE